MLYTVGITTTALLRPKDQYKRFWLSGGIIVAAVVGLYRHYTLRGIVLDLLPWAVMISLIFGAAFESAIRQRRRVQRRLIGAIRDGFLVDLKDVSSV